MKIIINSDLHEFVESVDSFRIFYFHSFDCQSMKIVLSLVCRLFGLGKFRKTTLFKMRDTLIQGDVKRRNNGAPRAIWLTFNRGAASLGSNS